MSIPILDSESLYADLGDIEAINLLSFAYKIASGMVHTTIMSSIRSPFHTV